MKADGTVTEVKRSARLPDLLTVIAIALVAYARRTSCMRASGTAEPVSPSAESRRWSARARILAVFQVASQFNLLEMTGPDVTPEHGVTRYAFDRTQGPACAVAAGAATIYRNYFAPVDGHVGQTRDRQIDCLRDLGAALGNADNSLWTMRNGYALCTESGLASIARTLNAMSVAEQDLLRDRLRVGLHWDVEVTGGVAPGLLVSQVFCSALPVAYTRIPSVRWQAFATLVLEGAYEATLWAAVLNTHRTTSNVVYLTRVGGGAFGNETAWIDGAIRRALKMVAKAGLDVRLVSYGQPEVRLVGDFR